MEPKRGRPSARGVAPRQSAGGNLGRIPLPIRVPGWYHKAIERALCKRPRRER